MNCLKVFKILVINSKVKNVNWLISITAAQVCDATMLNSYSIAGFIIPSYHCHAAAHNY